MKILLVGFGRINKKIFERYVSDIIGIITNEEKHINNIPDIIIDFSHPDMLDETIFYANKYMVPVLIGTTGYSEEKMAQIKELSEKVAVMKSNNFSLGIYLINKILKDNISIIKNYEKKIVEIHHKDKADKISGTALMLSNILDTNNVITERIEDTNGEHKIILVSNNEEIIIAHSALDRMAFVVGVEKAMNWLLDKKANLYSFEDTFDE